MTSIDFPGRLAAVLYCQGCPWRCSYCHNPQLLAANTPPALSWADALAFLRSRLGLLDGAVFSGGEPLAQRALRGAVEQVRALGLQTALHTGGMFSERLAELLPLFDWVGLDIKAPPARYDAITTVPGSGARAYASLRHLAASGTPYECRTTWHAGLFPVGELLELADILRGAGVQHWALQECRAPDAPAWALDKEQTTRLGAGFASFTLRRA